MSRFVASPRKGEIVGKGCPLEMLVSGWDYHYTVRGLEAAGYPVDGPALDVETFDVKGKRVQAVSVREAKRVFDIGGEVASFLERRADYYFGRSEADRAGTLRLLEQYFGAGKADADRAECARLAKDIFGPGGDG
jgi:hypothetical protein